jgi:hypothetical protein
LVLFWYGLVPMAGILVSRRGWRRFRQDFDRLRLAPTLDYAQYTARGRTGEGPEAEPAEIFRFTGGFESITDSHTLWVQGPDLTIPVALTGARIYTLPVTEGRSGQERFEPSEETFQRLRWDRVAALTGEARVFVGGTLVLREGRWIFADAPGASLLVIFYTGSNRSMAICATWAGRRRNEYWNNVTPYALALGALCLITMAVTFLPRPAFRLTSITAFMAAFTPLFPLVPPGLLLTIACRWLWQRTRIYRIYRDLARLPLIHFSGGIPAGPGLPVRLPSGESYGLLCADELPQGMPSLTPGIRKPRKERWYVFGALSGAGEPEKNGGGKAAPKRPEQIPGEPEDSFAAFGAVPGDPERLSRRCACRAYLLEILSWFLLMGGIGLNAFFIAQIVIML